MLDPGLSDLDNPRAERRVVVQPLNSPPLGTTVRKGNFK